MSNKFIVLLAVLCTVEAASSPSTGHIFQAEKNVEYALNKPLEVGDVIRAWGVYRDHSTSKFSVNIKGQGGLYLLHVDFRPWNNVVVLNNYVYGWKAEIRPWFSKYNFSWNKLFEVKVEVHEEHYRIYFNGVELRRRFPHRIDISRADHVALQGGSNGFKWSALKLPNSKAERVMGVPFSTTTNEKNYLERSLAVGDKLTAWGIYATGSVKFSVNLMMETELHFMMHVDFRPPPNENKVVLNSKKENGWEREIRTPIPQFENGKVFSVTVVCLEGEFEIYHDNQVLGSRFPYRDGFKLEDVKFVWLLGGSRGMIWTDLAISQPRPEYQVKVMCDDISTIFVDGEQQTVSGTGVWNQIATLNIPTKTQTIGVQCRNTGGPYGLMAQVTEESGEVITVTDESWQCSNMAEDGWSTRQFRGSWTRAVITYQQLDFQREEGDWTGMSRDRRIIWTNSAADTTVYCRRDLSDSDSGSDTEIFTEVTVTSTTETEAFTEESTEITEVTTKEETELTTVPETVSTTSLPVSVDQEYQVKVMCDDISTIFVDGEQQTVSGTGVWNQIATLNIPTTTQTIGVQCRNTGGPYGLMAQVTEESGEVITVTDESWQCSNMAEYGWSTRQFRGSWTRAVITYQQLDFQREEGAWAGMSRDRRVIWTNSAADTTVYCRRDLLDSGSETEIFTEETVTTTTTTTFTEKIIEITEEPTEEKAETTVSESMTTSSQGTPAYTVPQECNDFTTGTIRNFDFETSGMLQRFEGKFQIITCKMRRTEIDSCNDVLSGLKNETNLFLHHSDNQHQVDHHEINENNQTTILEGDERYLFKVQFKFEIKYETHHERSIYCGATNSDNSLRVVSNRRRFPRVEKLYKVSISPKEVRVPTNTPFTLTCFFEDPEVKDYVYWQTKDSNDDMPWMTVGNSRIANNNSSVLTITKSKEWKGTYSCSTRRNLHPNKYRDQAIVEVFDPEITEPTVTATSQPKEPTSSTESAGSVSPTESEEPTSTTSRRKPTEAPRPSCKEDEFTCSERCISSTWRCDGDKDCIGGEDEENCDKTENEIKPF